MSTLFSVSKTLLQMIQIESLIIMIIVMIIHKIVVTTICKYNIVIQIIIFGERIIICNERITHHSLTYTQGGCVNRKALLNVSLTVNSSHKASLPRTNDVSRNKSSWERSAPFKKKVPSTVFPGSHSPQRAIRRCLVRVPFGPTTA